MQSPHKQSGRVTIVFAVSSSSSVFPRSKTKLHRCFIAEAKIIHSEVVGGHLMIEIDIERETSWLAFDVGDLAFILLL